MRALIAALCFTCGAVAQTAIVPATAVCPPPQITIATKTGTLGTSAIIKFFCVQLDPTVTQDTSTSPPTIKAVSAPSGSPKLTVENFSVDANLPQDAQSFPFTLKKVPALGTFILIFYKGSALGFNLETAILNPTQQGTLQLPFYHPFPGDVLTAIYWAF
jgi:hypothetical protein